MFAAVVGIILGAAVVGGPLLWLDHPVTSVADSMVLAAAEGGTSLLNQVPFSAQHPQVVALFSTILALCAPGVVALGLAVAARSVRVGRQMLSGVLLLGALASFLVLPSSQAVVLMVAAVICSGALLAPVGWLAQVALWGLATVLAGHHAVLLLDGSSPSIEVAVDSFTALSGLTAPGFWRLLTVIVGLAPFAAAAMFGLGDHRPSRQSA